MEVVNQDKDDNFQEGRKGAFQRKNISGVCTINPGDLEDGLRCRSLEMHLVMHALDKLVREHFPLYTLSNRARLKEMEGPFSQENESHIFCLDSSLGDATIQKGITPLYEHTKIGL